MTLDPPHSEPTFGEMQGRKVLDGKPWAQNARFFCKVPECGEGLMSDEALQMHRIHHDLITLTATLREMFLE